MDKFDQLSTSPMVFTLTEEKENHKDKQYSASDEQEDWERGLEKLRHSRLAKESSGLSTEDTATILQHIQQSSQVNQHDSQTIYIPQTKTFNDTELDNAYREYLRQYEANHNAQEGIDQEDVGILMQEDWLQAQSALQIERNRRHAQPIQTLIFEQSGKVTELPIDVQEQEMEKHNLPEFAVHVYALPDMPATRKLKIISEKELIAGLCAKLTPHLANAVAGMVRQILQKKLATLSYELQMQFNEETPQLVQEVLEYNLDSIVRTVKYQLHDK